MSAPDLQQTNGFDSRVTTNGPEKVNILVAKKKRVNLTSSNTSIPSARVPPKTGSNVPSSSTNSNTTVKRAQFTQIDSKTKSLAISSPRSTSFANSFPAPSEQPFGDLPEGWSSRSEFVQPMQLDVHIDAFDTTRQRGKRKASFSPDGGGPRIRARTLGGDRPVEVHTAREISRWSTAPETMRRVSGEGTDPSSSVQFARLPLLTYLSSEVEGSNEMFEAKNMDEDGTTEIAFISGKQTEWLDYLPSPAIAVKATSSFCAVAMQDGTVNVYSHTGRRCVPILLEYTPGVNVVVTLRLIPTMSLESQCSIMEGSKNSLLVITIHGQLYSWYLIQ